MLLKDSLASSGAGLFRWRSYLLLGFVPFILIATLHGERLEAAIGDTFGDVYEWFCILMVVAGEAVRILTVGFVPRGTSGRNTAGQLAESLNTTGFYSLCRNPLYFGNCLMYLGVALFTQSLGLALVIALVLALYYERIIFAEESFLAAKFGAPYAEWAERTPVFVPRLWGWVRPNMPFSLATVIRREHASVLAAILALYLVELGLHTLGNEGEPFESGWHWVAGIALLLDLVALMLKRHTRILAVEGR